MQTLSESPPKVNAKDKAKALRQRIDESVDALAEAVDAVRASDTFRAYLDIQARFHRYSWCNSMLIMTQRPNATRVAGFQSWKKLGRHVRKGERGIMIFAPCPWARERETGNGDTETEQGIFFKAVHVFDEAQTDGAALPTVDVPTVDADASDLLLALERVCVQRSLSVDYRKLEGSAFGVANRDGTIAIDNTHPTGQRAKTLAHEIAHHALHFDKANKTDGLTRETAELEAEAVAYVVCRHFGLDVGVRASRYIALWQGDGKALRASLERIAKAARDIIDDCPETTDKAENRRAVA